MALIVETGTGLPNAESYNTVAQFKAYAAKVGATIPSSDKDCEILLRKGMQALRRGTKYRGQRATRDQSLDFPRYGIVIEGFAYASSELPANLLEAHCLYSIAAATIDLMPVVRANVPGAIIERTVGPITTKYAATGMINNVPKLPAAEALLAPLLIASGNIMQVTRA